MYIVTASESDEGLVSLGNHFTSCSGYLVTQIAYVDDNGYFDHFPFARLAYLDHVDHEKHVNLVDHEDHVVWPCCQFLSCLTC